MPNTLKVPYPGFGYPLYGVSNFHPWEPFSTPNTLGIHPPKRSSFSVVEKSSRISLSALAFPYKTLSGLVPTLQRFAPTKKAALLSLPPKD
jgi:hypothetical protein